MTEEIPNITINLKRMQSDTVEKITVPSNIAVNDFLHQVSELLNTPEDQIRLIFRGRVLKRDTNLSEYNIEDGHTIQIVPNRQHSENNPPPDPLPPTINVTVPPQVTIRVVNMVQNATNVNSATNPQVYQNLVKIQCMLSELQLAASNLQNEILAGSDEQANYQLQQFIRDWTLKEQEIKAAINGMTGATVIQTEQTTTANIPNPNGAQNPIPANPFQNVQLPPVINDIFRNMFNIQ